MVYRFFNKKREKMGFDPATLAMNAAGTGINALMGLALGGIQDRRQLKQQEKLNQQQFKFDGMALDRQKAADYEMWEKTSFPGQLKQMEKAGLSPGMMYGGSGGGGSVTGSTASINAPKAPTGGGEIMGMQLMQAQKDLIEAQTTKTKAEAAKTAGVDTDIANVTLKQLRNEANMYLDSYEATYNKILAEASKAVDEAQITRNRKDISDETKQTEIDMKQGELIGLGIVNELKKAETKLTQAQIDETIAKIQQRWEEISIQKKNMIINGDRLALERFIRDIPDSTRIVVENVGRIAAVATGRK